VRGAPSCAGREVRPGGKREVTHLQMCGGCSCCWSVALPIPLVLHHVRVRVSALGGAGGVGRRGSAQHASTAWVREGLKGTSTASAAVLCNIESVGGAGTHAAPQAAAAAAAFPRMGVDDTAHQLAHACMKRCAQGCFTQPQPQPALRMGIGL